MIQDGITFDDVILEPKYSRLKTRSDVDLSVILPKINTIVKHPIIPSNMKTIINYEMSVEVIKNGGIGILHRFMPLYDQINILTKLQETFNKMVYRDINVWSRIGFSIGVKVEDYEVVKKLVEAGVKIICIDVAHGHSKLCIDMCEYIANNYPDILLIAGNVATDSGAYELWSAGADIVKVGIGPGSLCTTRIETGNGVPQLTALMNAVEARNAASSMRNGKKDNVTRLIISDGGVKNAGDATKALCFADMVMTGNIFAGCEESPGEILNIDGRQYKEYVGSSTHKANHIEGVAALVPAKNNFGIILTKLLEGIKSGCSYQGVDNLKDLKSNPVFIRMSGASLKESHPHDVILK